MVALDSLILGCGFDFEVSLHGIASWRAGMGGIYLLSLCVTFRFIDL